MTQSCFISEIDASLRRTLLSPKGLSSQCKFLPCEIHHLSLCPGSLIIKPEIRRLNKAWAVPAQEAQVSLYIGPSETKGVPEPHTISREEWYDTNLKGNCLHTVKPPNPPMLNPQFKQSKQNEERSASWTQLSLRYCPKRRHSKNCVQSTWALCNTYPYTVVFFFFCCWLQI